MSEGSFVLRSGCVEVGDLFHDGSPLALQNPSSRATAWRSTSPHAISESARHSLSLRSMFFEVKGALCRCICASGASQSCAINNGSGTVSTVDVSNVSISCSGGGGFTVRGTVQGGSSSFSGSTVPVTLTSGSVTETLNVSLAQTQFVFNTLQQTGQSYSVSSPAESFQLPGVIGALVCSAINVGGTITGGHVTDIVLNCVPPA